MQSASQSPARASEVIDRTETTVRRWIDESAEIAAEPAERRLAELVAERAGLAVAIAFTDGVVRPEDLRVAARNFERMSRDLPSSLPLLLRILIQLGGGFSVLLPWPVVPLARAVFHRSVGHLVLDTGSRSLDGRIAALRERGTRLTMVPLAATALGPDEADHGLAAVMDLLGRDDVDSVSLRLSAVAPPAHPWAHDESVTRIVERLVPLYEFAATAATAKLITIDLEGPRQLDLTLDVFTSLLSRPGLEGYEGGITLSASAPDSLGALQRLGAWASDRRARGGAGIRVRIVDGDHSAGITAGHVALLDWALTPQRTDAVRIVVDGQHLVTAAFAWTLADAREVGGRVEIERMLGVANARTEIVARHAGGVVLSTPVVAADRRSAAVGALVERLGESARAAAPDGQDASIDAEVERLRLAATMVDETSAAETEPAEPAEPTVDSASMPVVAEAPIQLDLARTDIAHAEGRQWARQVLARAKTTSVASALLDHAVVRDVAALDLIVERTGLAGDAWSTHPLEERARAVLEFADVLEALRGRIVEVLVSEIGATFAEADAEAVRAVGLARAAAAQGRALELVDHAEFAAASAVLVAPGWSSPIADTVEAVATAITAGSAVIVQPAHQARRAAALVIEALREAGLPEALATLVVPEDASVAKAAIAHTGVDRVVFTGDRDTAMLLRSWRPDRPPLGDVPGVASVIVTESADLELAAGDIVQSAFVHGGQHPQGTRLVILVGAAGQSESFRRRLADAVRATHPAPTLEASSRIGPLIATPAERVRRLLADLEADETWLVQPEAMDDRLTLWRPGIRDGVAAASAIQRTPAAPVITLTTVPDLEAAIALQNAARGEAAAIHTLDLDELAAWLDSADTGTLHVNRPTIGAPADALPVGGWRGTGGLRGGPDRMLAFGDWAPVFAEAQQSVRLDGIGERVRTLIEAAQPSMQFLEFDLVRAGAVSDELAWAAHYRDAIDLGGRPEHRSVVRYLPATTTIRLAAGVSSAQLVRVLAAATRAGATVHISSATPVPEQLVGLFGSPFSPLRVGSVLVESDARWHARVQSGEVDTPHVRLIGGDATVLATVFAKRPDVALSAAPVTTAGRLELLPFLRAQVVSMASTRHGMQDPMVGEIEF
jgi:RHH-type proline utilization regulon transcriptional repressor/proline dehydrogenase/delta 1-pyrroline-5-carboxylate dehydrogenase